MSPVLRWLIWLAVLVAGFSVTLDWQDELTKIRPERERMEQMRQREGSAMLAVDWTQALERAGQAQIAWKERLPEVTQMGVFRAEALEAMADLCSQLEARCQVSALGEKTSSRAKSASANAKLGTHDAMDVLGLVSTSVRLNVGLSGEKLASLLNGIERGAVLRKVEKFSVRGGQADMVVTTFGIENHVTTGLTAGDEGKP